MGQVRNRGGVIQLDFRYQGIRCRESTFLPDTPANKRRCETMLKRIEAEISLGTFDYTAHFPGSGRASAFARNDAIREAHQAGVPLFSTFAETWFAEKEIEWRRSYKVTIRATLANHLIPKFGNQPISAIDKAQILAFRAELGKLPARLGSNRTLGSDRINHILTPLRMILEDAAGRFGFASPWQGIKRLKFTRPEVSPFTLDEVRLILRAVRSDYRAYYTVRFFTGLRSSEVHGLRWANVDLDSARLHVREAFVGKHMETTKTDGSQRSVALNPLVVSALREQALVTGLGGSKANDFVFSNRNGQPFNDTNVTKRVWDPLLRHLDLKRRRPYQTRHTAATLWLAAGENPEWIARQMGHTTTEMLFRVYSRYVPNLTRQDGSAFDAMVAAAFSPSEPPPEER
jgi:integrase